MNRRSLILSGFSAVTLEGTRSVLPNATRRAWFELRFYHLRNDLNRLRLEKFLSKEYLVALRRMGRSPVGVFNVSVGSEMPMLVTLSSYPSLGQMEIDFEERSRNADWNKALAELDQPEVMAYTRIDSFLLRAFATMPTIELPSPTPNRQPHLFELRVYESRNLKASEAKVRMFDEGEITIFRQCGMVPIFFAQTVIGVRLPSLVYMLAYDSMEARETAWGKFVNHPDWLKLKSKPGLSDKEIVSNISNSFLRPTDYSEIL